MHIPHPSVSLVFWYLQKQSTEPGLFLHSNFALGQVESTAHSSISTTQTQGAEVRASFSDRVAVHIQALGVGTCAVVPVSCKARLTCAGVVLFCAAADGIFVAGEGERRAAHV